jgi:hypothetical protein
MQKLSKALKSLLGEKETVEAVAPSLPITWCRVSSSPLPSEIIFPVQFMNKKYRAMQIVAPGVLEMTERPLPAAGPDEVLIKIEACGVCGADLRDAEKAAPAASLRVYRDMKLSGLLPGKGTGTRYLANRSAGRRRPTGRLLSALQPLPGGLFHLCENQLTRASAAMAATQSTLSCAIPR